jgi:hypothetical protein
MKALIKLENYILCTNDKLKGRGSKLKEHLKINFILQP